MATEIMRDVGAVRGLDVVRPPGTRVSWGAIFAGLFATLGIWALLSAIGAAVGFTVFRMGPGVAREGVGLFSSLWALATPLVAFLFGGLVAGRLSGAASRLSGTLHGLVMWSVSGLVMIALGGIFLDVNNILLTLQTGEGAGYWLWGLVGAMTLSLLAAMLGAALGAMGPMVQGATPVQRTLTPVTARGDALPRDVIGATPGPAVASRGEGLRDERAATLHDERRTTSAGAGAAVLAGAGAAAVGARAASTRRGERILSAAERAGLTGRQEEVPRERWGDLLEALSELHRDDPVRVELAGARDGTRPLIERSPLMGLELDERGAEHEIDLVVGSGTAIFDHRIQRPQHLYFHEDTELGTADLAIEDAAHQRTLIHFSAGTSRRGMN